MSEQEFDREQFTEEVIQNTTFDSLRNARTGNTAGKTFSNSERKNTLQEALEDAWHESGLPPGTQFRVVNIWAVGQNAFTGYRVDIAADPR